MPGCSLKWALSPSAPSACERVWNLSVFINFKDAFACFCHSLCWFLINFPPLCSFWIKRISKILCSFTSSVSLSGSNTSAVTCSFCLYPFAVSFVVTLLYKKISKGNILSRETLYCTLDTGELRIYSLLLSSSFTVCLHISARTTVWCVDKPILLDLSQLRRRFVKVSTGFCCLIVFIH